MVLFREKGNRLGGLVLASRLRDNEVPWGQAGFEVAKGDKVNWLQMIAIKHKA